MNEQDWIRPREFVSMARRHGRQDTDTLLRLKTGLRSGRIGALVLDGRTAPTGEDIYSGPENETAYRDWHPPASAWEGNLHNSDLDLMNDLAWSNAPETGFGRVRMHGLAFNRAEIMSYFEFPAPVTPLGSVSAKGRGGRKAARGWPVFAASLAEWVLNSGDDEAGFAAKGSDAILSEVLRVAQTRTDEDLPRSTYQPAVQEFVDLMTQVSRRK